ncbi:MAG: Holliday junction branch migration protein RuvA [Nitrospirota bacterium]
MIALLTGRLVSKSPAGVIIDVSGVGYRAHIPLSSFYGLPDIGAQITLHIHTHVREDALLLYGFVTEKEKELFLLLTSVSGVGPKLALNVVSGLPLDILVDAITRGDERKISTIPGIGLKTAARLVLELRDKVGALGVPELSGPCSTGNIPNRQKEEAVSALVNLGYKKNMAEDAVKRVCAAAEDISIEALIREALKVLSKG